MIDIQLSKEKRGIILEKAGIKELHYPVRISGKNRKLCQTPAAVIELSVEVPADVRGTHMSRFTEIIHRFKNKNLRQYFPALLKELCRKLKTTGAYACIAFPFYLERKAPVSQKISLMEYHCELKGLQQDGEQKLYLSVTAGITTLCPCSKALADAGAHNQRANVTVTVDISKEQLWIEDIIHAIEDSASAPLYALLKRPDEKYVTEQAYQNPQFVEDIVREVYPRIEQLYTDKMNCDFFIVCESFESIHRHNAFAQTGYRAHLGACRT